MNLAYAQRLQAQQQSGSDRVAATMNPSAGAQLGTGMRVDIPEQTLPNVIQPQAETEAKNAYKLPEETPKTVGQTFANEIIRRLGEQVGAEGQPKDPSALRHSLGSTMDWLRERFGDDTAAAASGMILQSTSSGVNEESLGEGLLNTLKFIDRNFGIAAGDATMSQFNSSVNSALNNYFDNGKTELFFDAGTVQPGAVSAKQDLHARFITHALPENEGESDEISLTEKILKDIEGELKKIGELQDLTQKLEAEFNPAQANTRTALTAYQAPVESNEPQLASINV